MTIIRTASDLKRAAIATGSHFFDRSSMNHFGDRMSNYYVPQVGKRAATFSVVTNLGQTHHCYELQRKRPVRAGQQSPAYFDTTTFRNVFPMAGSTVCPHN